MDELMSIRATAKLLDMPFVTLSRWIKEIPTISVHKVGKSYGIVPGEVVRELQKAGKLQTTRT